MPEVFVKSFQAVDEKGQVFDVHEHQNMIETRDLSGPSTIAGLKSYRLADGGHLNTVEGGFVNVRTGAKLIRK